jgi:hypothetical protein
MMMVRWVLRGLGGLALLLWGFAMVAIYREFDINSTMMMFLVSTVGMTGILLLCGSFLGQRE